MIACNWLGVVAFVCVISPFACAALLLEANFKRKRASEVLSQARRVMQRAPMDLAVLAALRTMPYETRWDAGGEWYCFKRSDYDSALMEADVTNSDVLPFPITNKRAR